MTINDANVLPENNKVESRRICLVIGLLFALGLGILLLAKDHSTLTEPRIYAEEGAVWLKQGYEKGPLSALLYFYKGGGRYELGINVVTALASRFPMEYAPFFSAWFSFLFYLLTFYLTIYNRNILGLSLWKRCMAALFVLLCCYSWGSVFLTSALSQPLQGVLAFVLLLSDYSNRRKTVWWSAPLLAFCGLSSLYACFLTPASWFKAYWTRNRTDIANSIVLTIVLYFQIFLLISMSDMSAVGLHRGNIDINTPLYMLYGLLLQPFISTGSPLNETITTLNFLYGWMIWFIIGLFAFYLLRRRSNRQPYLFLLIAYAVSAMAVTYSSLLDIPSRYYASLPRTILFFFLISLIRPALFRNWKPFKPRETASSVFQVVIVLILSLAVYNGLVVHFRPFWYSYASVPPWGAEVKRFETMDNYLITVYPSPTWKVNFGKSHPIPTLQVGREADIDDIMPYMDFYQLHQVKPANADRRYITYTTIELKIEVKEKGRYQLEGLTQAIDRRHGSWFLRTDWAVGRLPGTGVRRIPWHIPVSDDWTWTKAPEVWHLLPGIYTFYLEPRQPTPLAGIRISPVE